MTITIKGEIALVPVDREGGWDVLSEKERATIAAFPDLIIEVESEEALPLQVFLAGSSFQLSIYPKSGHIVTASQPHDEYENDPYALAIMPNPFRHEEDGHS